MNTATPAHALTVTLHYAEPPSFSTWEMVLLALLIVLSLVGFFARVARVLRNIFTARKDPDFHIAPVGRRISDFFWEVLCQAKVIKERPLPGLAHAFVFWGFLAFALVSLNHFASGFRLGFLDADGYVGGFYFWFAAIFALLVAVSIAGLFIRRFFVRPIWLGTKGLLRIRRDRVPHLRADGHLPRSLRHPIDFARSHAVYGGRTRFAS